MGKATANDKNTSQQPSDWKYESKLNSSRLIKNNAFPVAGITHYDAFAYCKNTGGRLPLLAEWQAIAMGDKNRLFAYGNQFNKQLWQHDVPLLNAYKICDKQLPNIDGIKNLSSGVAEWTSRIAIMLWSLVLQH